MSESAVCDTEHTKSQVIYKELDISLQGSFAYIFEKMFGKPEFLSLNINTMR